MGRQVSLIRVPNWWAADRKYTRYSCNVEHIVYQFVSENTKVRELFRLGQLDVFNAREADIWYEGLEMDPVHRGLIQRVHFSNIWPRNCFGFHLNCSKPPFNEKMMRRGFHHALNVQQVLDTVFRGTTRAWVRISPVSASTRTKASRRCPIPRKRRASVLPAPGIPR